MEPVCTIDTAPTDVAQAIIGFLDGDGCITVPHPHGALKRPCVCITVSQSKQDGTAPELVLIQRYCGGSIHQTTPAKRARETWRTIWRYTLTSTAGVVSVLRAWVRFGHIKRQQAVIALAYLEEGRVDVYGTRFALSGAKHLYQNVVVEPSSLTDAYVGGLFVADGCASLRAARTRGKISNYRIDISISKPLCLPIMHALKTFYGFGSVSTRKQWHARGVNAREFLLRIQPHLFGQKVPQVERVMHVCTAPTRRRERCKTQEELDVLAECERELKRLKRT